MPHHTIHPAFRRFSRWLARASDSRVAATAALATAVCVAAILAACHDVTAPASNPSLVAAPVIAIPGE